MLGKTINGCERLRADFHTVIALLLFIEDFLNGK